MAIVSAVCSSFKTEVLEGIHNVSSDVIKIALYTSVATLNGDTTAYTSTGEVSGAGYTTGGETITDVAVYLSGSTAIVDFADVNWSNATFTTRGALIYNSSKANRAIAVLDFGADKSAAGGTLRVTLPAPAASTALIRLV
jgi:hypothetical protein